MSDGLWLGILGFLTTIVTILIVPMFRSRQEARQKKEDREANWARDDEIAERLARKVSDTASHASTAREAISSKLDDVKTLVNGNVTDLLRAQLDSLVREVALLEQNRELKIALKQEIGPTEAASLELARARLRELRIQLDFKITADKAVDGDRA